MQTQTLGNNTVGLGGSLGINVIRGDRRPPTAMRLRDRLRKFAVPNTGNREVDAYRLRNLPNVLRGLSSIAIARAAKAPTFTGVVQQRVFRGCEYDDTGRIINAREIVDLGIVSCRVVTTVGCGAIVDAFQNLVELEIFIYHGYGTGSNAEASSDTTLHTELTTQYLTNNTRPTGSATEASATVFRSVGTLSPDANCTITEHGLFSQASNAGGILFDRSLFTGIALVGSSDSLQTTYDGTFTAGG